MSLVGQVRIAVDGHNGVPLRVQVFARGALASPAISVGFSSITFATPAAADTSFTPPAGAKITKESLGQQSTPGGKQPGPGPVSANGTSGESAAALRALIGSAAVEHGAWGTGRLLHTSLISVLMTDSGSPFAGAVQPSVLYAAASKAATAPRPATTP